MNNTFPAINPFTTPSISSHMAHVCELGIEKNYHMAKSHPQVVRVWQWRVVQPLAGLPWKEVCTVELVISETCK